MQNKELEELKKILNRDPEELPDEDFYFDDDYHYIGREYNALGTIKYKEKTYEFLYNEEWGINVESLEEIKNE